MPDVKKFVLDANVLITASQSYYGFDICPGFWKGLKVAHEAGRVVSIDKVKAELTPVDDELKDWAMNVVPSSFFKKTDDVSVIRTFAQLQAWAQHQTNFSGTARDEFARVADGWLIAYAKANNLVVVTHEEFHPEAKNRVLIPNVCVAFDVEYVNSFNMLRELGARFGLKKIG